EDRLARQNIGLIEKALRDAAQETITLENGSLLFAINFAALKNSHARLLNIVLGLITNGSGWLLAQEVMEMDTSSRNADSFPQQYAESTLPNVSLATIQQQQEDKRRGSALNLLVEVAQKNGGKVPGTFIQIVRDSQGSIKAFKEKIKIDVRYGFL